MMKVVGVVVVIQLVVIRDVVVMMNVVGVVVITSVITSGPGPPSPQQIARTEAVRAKDSASHVDIKVYFSTSLQALC